VSHFLKKTGPRNVSEKDLLMSNVARGNHEATPLVLERPSPASHDRQFNPWVAWKKEQGDRNPATRALFS